MSYRLVQKPRVARDVKRQVRFYESRRTGFGGKFLDEYEAALNQVQRFPGIGHVKFDDILVWTVSKRFPEMIFYEVDDQEELIILLGVIHPNRDSKLWKDLKK